MRTLYININNETIRSNDELKVLNYDLDSDFFFYLSGKVAKGCNVETENVLITNFNTQDNKEDYLKIISQWNELKTILFSNKCKGDFEFTLPSGYLHWLKFHPEYAIIYDKNFSQSNSGIISINLEELYEDSVKDLQRMILRKLYKDKLSIEIDEIVFNDNAVTRSSSIVRTIKKMYENIEFKVYRMWLQENEEKSHTTLQFCEKCKKYPCECKLGIPDHISALDGIGLGKICIEQIGEDESVDMDNDDDTVSPLICSNCDSDDVEDDDTFTCNDCGRNWGRDNIVECPQCGSYDVENDETDNYNPYECNVCGYIWGEGENDEEYYEDDMDNEGHKMSEYYESFDIIIRKSTKYDIQKKGGKLIDSKSGIYKMPNGIGFTFFDNSSIVDSIHIGKNAVNSIPQFYKSLGLYWGIDKNCFRNIFENLGFDVCEKDDILLKICANKYCAKFKKNICIEITYFDEDMLYLRVW